MNNEQKEILETVRNLLRKDVDEITAKIWSLGDNTDRVDKILLVGNQQGLVEAIRIIDNLTGSTGINLDMFPLPPEFTNDF
jgi:hypothetical protein